MTTTQGATEGAVGAADPEPEAGPERHLFPPGFVWGAATSAYQIEGSTAADGRGPSIWDTFSGLPGRTVNGESGDPGIDHYRRFREDVRMMADLGLRAYRFSVAWPRIQPAGSGPALQAGLDFYRRLVDELLAHDIEPWVTLYHWDLPEPLEQAGGWPVRDTAHRFADYAALVHGALGDRVRHWTTLNEPWCSAFLGYAAGIHAPGRTEPAAAMQAAHHLMLGHGLAVRALRAGSGDPRIGVTLNLYAVTPASGSAADRDAARRVDGLQNRLFLDPILLGRYPADVLADVAPLGALTEVTPEDLDVISTPLDSLGVNYYTRHVVTGAPEAAVEATGDGPVGTPLEGKPSWIASPWVAAPDVRMVLRGLPVTATGWEVDDAGLLEVLTRVRAEYPELPLYITENGAAFDDVVADGGRVADADRIAYLRRHLAACHRALAAGVPLRGYFAWSLADNFEWAEGYAKRFGLVHVDFATQRRTPKDSAGWYASVIRHGGPEVVQTLMP